MSPVFGHGRLRLYLLKLLEESPRHGYEVIRLLQDRFLGVYQPRQPVARLRGQNADRLQLLSLTGAVEAEPQPHLRLAAVAGRRIS